MERPPHGQLLEASLYTLVTLYDKSGAPLSVSTLVDTGGYSLITWPLLKRLAPEALTWESLSTLDYGQWASFLGNGKQWSYGGSKLHNGPLAIPVSFGDLPPKRLPFIVEYSPDPAKEPYFDDRAKVMIGPAFLGEFGARLDFSSFSSDIYYGPKNRRAPSWKPRTGKETERPRLERNYDLVSYDRSVLSSLPVPSNAAIDMSMKLYLNVFVDGDPFPAILDCGYEGTVSMPKGLYLFVKSKRDRNANRTVDEGKRRAYTMLNNATVETTDVRASISFLPAGNLAVEDEVQLDEENSVSNLYVVLVGTKLLHQFNANIDTSRNTMEVRRTASAQPVRVNLAYMDSSKISAKYKAAIDEYEKSIGGDTTSKRTRK